MMKIPIFMFDGGYVMIPWDDFEDAMEWYKTHMGWTFVEQEINHKMKRAAFEMPNGGHANFHTFRDEDEHFSSKGLNEGCSRLCFQVADVKNNLHYFNEHGIRYEELPALPDGTISFDLYAFGNTRLTLSVNSEFDRLYPNSRILSFATIPMRTGVTNVEHAARWYEDTMGMKVVTIDDQHALLRGNHSYHGDIDLMWLEKTTIVEPPTKSNPHARTYFLVKGAEQFINAHQFLRDKGVETSTIFGNPNHWAAFHFYDPDGNRLNVWIF